MTKIKLNFILVAVLFLSSGFTCQKKYPTAKPEIEESADSETAEPVESTEPSSASEEKNSSTDD